MNKNASIVTSSASATVGHPGNALCGLVCLVAAAVAARGRAACRRVAPMLGALALVLLLTGVKMAMAQTTGGNTVEEYTVADMQSDLAPVINGIRPFLIAAMVMIAVGVAPFFGIGQAIKRGFKWFRSLGG